MCMWQHIVGMDKNRHKSMKNKSNKSVSDTMNKKAEDKLNVMTNYVN